MKQFGKPEIPLFFKLWFAFVALVAICIIIVGYVGATLDSALGVAYRCKLARITGRRDA